MSVQQFCLRWNNHQPNFISVCSSLLHNGTLVDVTLAAEGRQLQAHKIVLSACSSYFQTLFTTNPCQHPIVILKDVQYNDLKTMVDFMYYGEVNVSQEQLPHILKTAEMLKIKGLAEMPADAATLTKSDSKSSSDQTDQLQGGSGSGSDSIWGSTESQFGQQQPQLQQQQQQQLTHHHHHSGSGHHQQGQSQQHHHQHHHHQLRRTPSPSTGTSPAARRKRIRKSSNNGSTERTVEEHSTTVESSTNINLSQMNQMSFGGSVNTAAIHSNIAKDPTAGVDTEHPHESSQESIDDNHQHHIQHIKPETDLSVQQSVPLDISGTTTPSDHDAPTVSCSQSQQTSHSGISSLSPIVQSTIPSTSSTAAAIMGSKRNRILIRQPRVKRDSDTLNPSLSPDTNPLEYELAVASGGHHFHSHHHGLLTVPPRIERHASEPAPSLTPSSPQLLTVPSVTGEHHHHSHGQPYLVKQHSHPLLPSQQTSSITSGPLVQGHGGSHSAGIVGYHQTHHHSLHRQLSHPLSSTSVTLSAISVAPMATITNPSLTQQLQQQQSSSTNSNSSSCSPCITSTYTQCGSSTSTLHYVSAAAPSTSSSIQAASSSSILNIKKEFDNISSVPPITKAHSSSGVILLSEQTVGSGITSPTLRVKSEELQRSVSSPQATIRELSLDNPRSSHCPVIRPGPALGCNFCWNTIDAHGRILRRKTKYHCPECQTNLCIVPCFQEYHERQSTDNNNPSNNKDNNKFSSSGLRHYPKTESI